jgi:hypothetical protein
MPLGRSSQGELGRHGMRHEWEWREKCTRFWWEIPKEVDYSEDQDVDGGIRINVREICWGGVSIWFDWLRIETSGELLWVQWWTILFLRHGVIYLGVSRNVESRVVCIKNRTLAHISSSGNVCVWTTGDGKPKCSVMCLPHCHIIHQKSHMRCAATESGTPRVKW